MPGDCAPGLVLQKFNSTFSNGGVEYPVKFPGMSQRCKAAIAKTERSPVAKFQYKIIVLCVVINPGNFCYGFYLCATPQQNAQPPTNINQRLFQSRRPF